MAQKMTGALVFDERTDRYDIRFDLNSYYGGLHCGECFDVFVRGKWKPTRIEYGDNWYLVGIRAVSPVFCNMKQPCKALSAHLCRDAAQNHVGD